MSKRTKHISKQAQPRQFPWLWLAAGGALVLIVVGLTMSWSWAGSAAAPEQAGGSPRLTVDRTEIDEGSLAFETPVETTFRLSNVGNQPLQILGEPQVSLVEGC